MPKWLLVVGLLLVSPGAARAQPPIFQQQQILRLQQQQQQLRLQQNERQQQLLQQQTIMPPLGPRVGVPVDDAALRALEVQLDAEQLELTHQQSQLLQPTPPGTPQDRMRDLQENQRLQFQLQQQQLQMQQQQEQQQLLQQHLMDQQQRLNQLRQPVPGMSR